MGQGMQKESTENVARGWRSWLSSLAALSGINRLFRRKHATQSAQFTSAFVTLAAKMAKVDGVAVTVEWQAFEKFLDVSPKDVPGIKKLFDQAKSDSAGADLYIKRIAKMLGDDAVLKREVVECLLYVACADGILHPAEDDFVRQVATAFDLNATEFRSIRAMFIEVKDDPYVVLGLTPAASDAEIKSRYRILVAENHPDRLIAAGAPAAVIKAATTKLAAINAAHEAILKERTSEGVA
jgi:DnaJ like chaperone protein